MEDVHVKTQEQRDAEYRSAPGLREGDPLPKILGTGTGGASRKSAPHRRWAGNAGRGARVVGAGEEMSLYGANEERAARETDDGQEQADHG
jgi:hypothetical protein